MTNIGTIGELAEVITEEATQAGLKELSEFTKTTYDSYIIRFSAHKLRLEKMNINTAVESGNSVTQSLSVLNRLSTVIHTYPSYKGGGDVLPEDELNKIQTEAKDDLQKRYNDETSNIRKWATKTYNDNEIIKASLEIMRDVYSLREQIIGVTEKFTFIYRGGTNVLSVKEIPVHEFFNKILQATEDSDYNYSNIFSLSPENKSFNDQGLRFNKAQMNKILKGNDGIFGKREDMKSIKGLKKGQTLSAFFREKRDQLKEISKSSYKDLNQYEKKWVIDWFARRKKGNIEKNISGFLRYEEGKYFITAKEFNAGFIAQEIYNAWKNDQNYDYKVDKVPWYQGGDVKDSKNIEYSVKSFLEGSPALITINSLFTVVNKILTALIAGKGDSSEAQGLLRNEVFDASNTIAQAGGNDIQNLLNIITGIK